MIFIISFQLQHHHIYRHWIGNDVMYRLSNRLTPCRSRGQCASNVDLDVDHVTLCTNRRPGCRSRVAVHQWTDGRVDHMTLRANWRRNGWTPRWRATLASLSHSHSSSTECKWVQSWPPSLIYRSFTKTRFGNLRRLLRQYYYRHVICSSTQLLLH